METVVIAGRVLKAVGYGCMGLSQGYEPCDRSQAIETLNSVLDMGYDHLDTAALYGFGANEELLNEAIGHRRHEYFLASKCGLFKNADGAREINGRPDVIRKTCEDSLRRLGTDHIDLYYLHRKDPKIPIEESVGALSRLKEEGHIGAVGLSEVAPDTLRKAIEVTEIAALQSEYSLWTRNPEGELLGLCNKHNITLVAYSPVARGFLADQVLQLEDLGEKDLRRTMPRFQGQNFSANQVVLSRLISFCEKTGVSVSQAALTWLLAQNTSIAPIPGTRFKHHALENFQAGELSLDPEMLRTIGEIFSPETIAGERYNDKIMREVDAEKHRFQA
jgi:aryl-alcohol dehydrogenase-like predicted oxidoreductase